MLVRFRIRPRIPLIIKVYLLALVMSAILIPMAIVLSMKHECKQTPPSISNPAVSIPHKDKSCFPIPAGYWYSYSDDFGSPRAAGGSSHNHEGIDIMAHRNTPVVAMEDCIVEEIGWNRLGGNRINLVSLDGVRKYYYAHLENYAHGLIKGNKIKTGTMVGYIGSSGYGPPGSDTGTHPHLHLQMWIIQKVSNNDNKILVNPYEMLRSLEGGKE